jgi:hypothetical protein
MAVRSKRILALTALLCVLASACTEAMSQKSLQFDGEIISSPFVLEGERLDDFETCDGKGVPDADVYLEREDLIYLHARTDESGCVSFLVPEVNFSIPCKLIASKCGYGKTETNITILDHPELHIICPTFIEEGRTLKVRVVDDSMQSIPDAIVSINGETLITDENGTCTYAVPQVGFPFRIEIFAKKDGYEPSGDVEVWVLDNRTSLLSAPPLVHEGDEFEISYAGSKNIRIWFNGTYFDDNTVLVKAPHVNGTSIFQIKAYDENGTILDYRFVVVADNMEKALIVTPSFVTERETFNISVVSLENGRGLPGIRVQVGSQSTLTGPDGKTTFSIPHVEEDYERFQVRCISDNVTCAPRYVWVKRVSEHSLVVHCPSVARSGQNVTISITDIMGRNVFAVVTIENRSYFAWNGTATIEIPKQNTSRYTYIDIKSPGYGEEKRVIYIISERDSLNIDCPDSVGEGRDFLITVKDSEGNPAAGAHVWFNFQEYTTNGSGMIRLTAPDVLVDERFMIYAEKDGYLPTSSLKASSAVSIICI